MSELMYDLGIELRDDGSIGLEQDAGCGEVARIDLHPCQVHLLAQRAGLLHVPDPALLDRLHARHVGRIHALRLRLDHLHDLYYDEIVDHCGSGIEISLNLEAISDLVYELIDDLGAAQTPAPVTECHDKSTAISVTPKRGRPAKPDALTGAERQRAHRAKQGEPATAQQGALI